VELICYDASHLVTASLESSKTDESFHILDDHEITDSTNEEMFWLLMINSFQVSRVVYHRLLTTRMVNGVVD